VDTNRVGVFDLRVQDIGQSHAAGRLLRPRVLQLLEERVGVLPGDVHERLGLEVVERGGGHGLRDVVLRGLAVRGRAGLGQLGRAVRVEVAAEGVDGEVGRDGEVQLVLGTERDLDRSDRILRLIAQAFVVQVGREGRQEIGLRQRGVGPRDALLLDGDQDGAVVAERFHDRPVNRDPVGLRFRFLWIRFFPLRGSRGRVGVLDRDVVDALVF
jgi:hypothetical protein